MKHAEITGIYSVGSSVSVRDEQSVYNLGIGEIVRLGSAGELLYYHVKLDNVATPITFTARQLIPVRRKAT